MRASRRALLLCCCYALLAAPLLAVTTTLRGSDGDSDGRRELQPGVTGSVPPPGAPAAQAPASAAARPAMAGGGGASPRQQQQPMPPTVPGGRAGAAPAGPVPPHPNAGPVNANVGPSGWPVPAGFVAPPPATPTPPAQCEAVTPKTALAAEPGCPAAMRAFTAQTTEGSWTRHSVTDRETLLENFCATNCAQTYTATLTSRRRGCAPPTPRGDGPQLVPDGPRAYPANFPGLRLGCVMDPVDRQFCAVKRANPAEGDCAFYMSCCYGELAAQASGTGVDPAFFAQIDKICPGSAKYRNVLCV